MSTISINLLVRIAIDLIAFLGTGVGALLYGRAMVQNPDVVGSIPDKIAIGITHCLKGIEEAENLKRRLLRPERVRRIGRQHIRAGYVLLVLSGLLLAKDMIEAWALYGSSVIP